MMFRSRQDAGEKLGAYLLERGVRADLVLGLPRGGVVVAAAVARILQCPLDVLVVRKLGHPEFREFALGALAEPNTVVLDEAVMAQWHVDRRDLAPIIAEERARLHEYERKFARPYRPVPSGRAVVIADDGLATGATLEAAARSVRSQEAQSVVAAVPVASRNGAARIAHVTDAFHALLVDPAFHAVGQYYETFTQTTDEEVQALLA